MFDLALAEIYDLVYASRGQDFAAEAAEITKIIHERQPDAASLLDVGCGTGEHLKSFQQLFEHVEGMDQSEAMISIAQRKCPLTRFSLRNMCDFKLDRQCDAIISLPAAVAYLPSQYALRQALATMAQHLAPSGVLVVEPWYFPANYLDGYVAADIIRGTERTIARMSHTHRLPEAAQVDSHYVVADPKGIEHFTECHVFALWTPEEYFDAFNQANCTAEFIPSVHSGHGVFVAQVHG